MLPTPTEKQVSRKLRLYQLHKDLSELTARMHTTGFMVDKLNRDFLAWGLEVEEKEHRENLLALVNIPSFRGTDNDLRKLIYKRYETKDINRFHLEDPFNPDMYTKTGLISVDFDSLLQLVIDPFVPDELKQIIKVTWKMKSAQKARATFVTSAKVAQAIGPDGRLRPGWNSCGTDTGRFSCSEPNIMNLEQYIRAMYCAAPGKILIHGDASQLELRVMHAVSGDEVLGAALESGDVYAADAIGIFPQCSSMSTDKKAANYVGKLAPKQRKASKQVHLAFQYAAGTAAVYAQVLAEDFDAKFTHVATIHEAMKKRYSGTVRYWFEEQKEVLETGYSESRILGRRRYYPAEPPITEIANYPIQGTASDFMNLLIIRLDRKLQKIQGAALVDQLHDAVDIEANERDERRITQLLQSEAEMPISIGGREFIFPFEIKSSTSWGDL